MKKFELSTFLIIALIVLFSVSAYAAQFILGTTATQPAASVAVASSSPIFTFTRSLTLGMTGQDVSALNQILDFEFNTTIASPSTFSATTQSNVSKLQERYAAAILTPNGLTSGTGYVGPSTRTELNSLAKEYGLTVADFPAPAAPAAPTYPQIFTQTLSLGTVSSQVALLKTVLNSDPSTTLTYTTAAEQTDPANLFDAPTQIAVNKFQQKYASIILVPNGLSSPTGIVGSATRAKLNQLLASVLAKSTTTVPVVSTTYNVPVNTNTGPVNSCTSDTWGIPGVTGEDCSDPSWGWGTCQANGTQTRTCQITSVCPNAGANHTLPYATSQSCAYTAPPVNTIVETRSFRQCSADMSQTM